MIGTTLMKMDTITELLQYFNGSTAIVKTAKTFTATGIHTGITAGDRLYITGTSSGTSDGYYTVATVATGVLTMDETPAGSNETATITVNQEYRGGWKSTDDVVKLVGTINTSGTAVLYIDQSGDEGTNTDYTSSWAVTAATALSYSVEVVAPHARIRVRNNGADQTIMRAYLYGRIVT
jgi:hypothetical protein